MPAAVATIGSPEIAQSIAEANRPLPDGRQDAQYRLDLDIVEAADRAGFHLVLFAERHLGTDLCAWVLAGALASRMEQMRTLIAIHPGLWNPVMSAKLVASLDRICKKRVAVNIVNGWYEEEFKTFGGTVLKGQDRYDRTTEFIEVLRRLWTEQSVTYHGIHYHLDEARLMLKPASPTMPEIYSVSSSDEGRNFIAHSCDWWFVPMPKDPAATTDDILRDLETSIADMEERAGRQGRKVRYGINPFLAIGDSMTQALDEVVCQIFSFEPNADHRSEERVRQIERRMAPATKAGCIGRPADIRAQVRRFESMGIELMLLKLLPTVENMQKIGAEVIQI
jgi:FMNH2-dependent dimethyl sulfone monooxygenase